MRQKQYPASSARGDQAEFLVGAAATDLGWLWVPTASKYPALDGLVEVVLDVGKQRQATGWFLGVEIKSGTSKLRNVDATGFTIMVDHEARWYQLGFPVLVVFVDLMARLGPKGVAYYSVGARHPHASPRVRQRFLRSNVFGRTNRKELLALARDAHCAGGFPIATLRRYELPPEWDLRRQLLGHGSLKQLARSFYREWSREGVYSPVFGQVEVTGRGWRHLTRPRLGPVAVAQRLLLLPAARLMLERAATSHVLRRDAAGGRTLHRQVAVVTTAGPREAAVAVVVERARGVFKFRSVYEFRPTLPHVPVPEWE